MAFSLRMAVLRGSPLLKTLIRQKSGSVAATVLFSKFARTPKSPSFSRNFHQTLQKLQGNALNAGRTLMFACSPLAVYYATNSPQFKSLCEKVKNRLSSFTARCEPCCPCGPYAALCQHGVVIKPPSCEERRKQTWTGSLIVMVDAVFKSVLLSLQLFKLCILFTPVMLLYPIASCHCKLYQLWLWLMYHAVQLSGPVYVKLGQWAGTRRDLFSHAFCERFSQLHAQMNYRPHSWKETEKILRKCYGKRWRETIKLDDDQKPIGSGCVAQVYKGFIHRNCISQGPLDYVSDCETMDDVYFKDGVEIQSVVDTFSFFSDDDEPECYVAFPKSCGCLYEKNPDFVPVAVKVLHPGIRERFAVDLNLMNKVAWFMEFILPSIRWVMLRECVKEFSIAMARQMDLTHESRSLKRLCGDFCNNPNIKIPVPYMKFARRDVLVESFEEGKPMIEFVECTPHPCDYRSISLRRRMAEIGVDAVLNMVFNGNFAHADLHPGNIYVQNSEHFQASGHSTTDLG